MKVHTSRLQAIDFSELDFNVVAIPVQSECRVVPLWSRDAHTLVWTRCDLVALKFTGTGGKEGALVKLYEKEREREIHHLTGSQYNLSR